MAPELVQLCADHLPSSSDVAALALCSQALSKLLMSEARARRTFEEEQAALLRAAQAHKTAQELAFQPQFIATAQERLAAREGLRVQVKVEDRAHKGHFAYVEGIIIAYTRGIPEGCKGSSSADYTRAGFYEIQLTDRPKPTVAAADDRDFLFHACVCAVVSEGEVCVHCAAGHAFPLYSVQGRVRAPLVRGRLRTRTN